MFHSVVVPLILNKTKVNKNVHLSKSYSEPDAFSSSVTRVPKRMEL